VKMNGSCEVNFRYPSKISIGKVTGLQTGHA
jgi:hypothetical protein